MPRMVFTGMVATGKTVVINEIVRIIDEERYKLMAPTGQPATLLVGFAVRCIRSYVYF